MTLERHTATHELSDMYAKACGSFVSLASSQADLFSHMIEAQMRLWQAAQVAAIEAAAAAFSSGVKNDNDAVSPCLQVAAEELEECQEALIQAQRDVMRRLSA